MIEQIGPKQVREVMAKYLPEVDKSTELHEQMLAVLDKDQF